MLNWWILTALGILALVILYYWIHSLRQRIRAEKILRFYATSLYGQNTLEDILWHTSKNCIQHMGFADCVIYQKDETRNVLLQKAAFGNKNPFQREIINAIEIPVGEGIVGTVAATGKPEIISNTSKDPRYIVDDERRLSEIAVPIWVDGKIFGVIDSEHPHRNHYRRYHLRMLKKVAAICAERVSKYLTEEKLRSKIARDLHDEMGSTLTSINILCKVAMQPGQPEADIKNYLQKIRDNSARMMESMSDIVWAINPINDNFDRVLLRMKEFSAEILEPARINYYFSEEGMNDSSLPLNLEQRKNIYMIFKEALTNAVKYSKATEVNILLQKNEGAFRMNIVDNGEGFNASDQYSGNGLRNMQTRASESGANLKIESIQGVGTNIRFELPVT